MQIVKFHKVARTMHIIQFFNIASLYIPSADIPSLMQDNCILFYHKNLETFQFVNTIQKMYSTPAKMHIKVASCVKKITMIWHKWQHLCPHIHKNCIVPSYPLNICMTCSYAVMSTDADNELNYQQFKY